MVETKSSLAEDAPPELSMYLTEATLQNGSTMPFKTQLISNYDISEIQIHKKLDHENIVKVLAVDIPKRVVVMEHCEGGDLLDVWQHLAPDLKPDYKIMHIKVILKQVLEAATAKCSHSIRSAIAAQ